jgi:ribosomal-protein-alanine N-acetyltransferase
MNTSVIVSGLSESEIGEVTSLASTAGLSHWSNEAYLDELTRPHSISLAAHWQRVFAGFIVGRIIPSQLGEGRFDAEIYNFAVVEELRRRKVGSILMSSFIDRCMDRRVDTIWLEVRAASVPAINFYRKAGFSPVNIRKNFYTDPPDNALIMTLDLSVTRSTNW